MKRIHLGKNTKILIILSLLSLFLLAFFVFRYSQRSDAALNDLSLMVSASKTQLTLGETVNFSATVTGGTAPYVYCWDFDAPAPYTSKPAVYNNNFRTICYSSEQNPTYTFKTYGKHGVWLHVSDKDGTIKKAYLEISVAVGGTVVSATTPSPTGPGLVGDGQTDNADKLSIWANKQSGNVTVEFPAGTYRFKSQNTFVNINGLNAIELRPQPGAKVTMLFDPDNPNPPDAKYFLANSPNREAYIYVHDIDFVRDLDGGTVAGKVRAWAFRLGSVGYKWIVEQSTFNNWAGVFNDSKQPIVRRTNIIDQGSGLWYKNNLVIATTQSAVTQYSGIQLFTHLQIVIPGSLKIITAGGGETFNDNGNGTLTGNQGGSGTIDYQTSAWSITYGQDPGSGNTIQASWQGVHTRNSTSSSPGYFSQIFYKSDIEHEHFYYTSSSALWFSITRDSYIDHANGASTNYFFSGNQYGNVGYWNNYLKNPQLNVIFHGCCVNNSDMQGNYIDGKRESIGPSALTTINGNYDVTIAYNHVVNMIDNSTININNGGQNIKVHHNIFGLNCHAGKGKLYSFGNSCSPLGPTDDCNPVNTCALTSDNVCNEDPIPVTDPLPLEFTPPTQTSVTIAGGDTATFDPDVTLTLSAVDNGSGMGNTKRFPYQEGAVFQISNDSISWSEVRPYSTTTNWRLADGRGTKTVYVRFSDVDRNWSEPVSDTIEYRAVKLIPSGSGCSWDGRDDVGSNCLDTNF